MDAVQRPLPVSYFAGGFFEVDVSAAPTLYDRQSLRGKLAQARTDCVNVLFVINVQNPQGRLSRNETEHTARLFVLENCLERRPRSLPAGGDSYLGLFAENEVNLRLVESL